MSSFTNKTAKMLSAAFIGIIIISFIFTFDSSLSTGVNSSIGKVGGDALEFTEYEREYNYQLRMLSFQTGGKQLTSEQIEAFRVKERAFESLVSRKLLEKFAGDIGIKPGDASVRDNIRNGDTFKTNDQFDLVKYRTLLSQNRLTPSEFEEQTKGSIQVQRAQELLQTNLVSKTLAKDLLKIKQNKIKVSGIQIRESDFKKFVNVSDNEIKEFLSDETNKNRVQSIFDQRKPTLDRPEEVKASHILLKGEDAEKKIADLKKKANKRNFASLAREHSEGPSKSKGGDLGWFSKGRMVQEFEEVAFKLPVGKVSDPVKTQFGYHLILVNDKKAAVEAKLSDYQNEIAKELIQDTKNEEVKSLFAKVAVELEGNTTKSNWDKIAKKYDLTAYNEVQINRLNPRLGVIAIEGENADKLFALEEDKKLVLKEPKRLTILINKGTVDAQEIKDEDIVREQKSLARGINTKLGQDLMENLWTKYSVECVGRDLASRQEISMKCGL